MTALKLRKKMPAFAEVLNLKIDTPKLISELESFGLMDGAYTAARADTNNDENLFIKANLVCKEFFNAHDEASYQEVNLSKPSYSSSNLSENDAVRDRFAVYRTKRLDKSRPEYSEHADETKHDMDPQYLTEGSELQKLFAFFKGKPCRVRIARMKSGFRIKPHVDYDPSYVFRYHVPLLTNTGARLFANRRELPSISTQEVHMPADGRVFWINTGILHWAVNEGPTDRYHLLIDVTGDYEVQNIDHLKEL